MGICKGHTSTRRGKRVLVLMRDGNHFVAKFLETSDLFMSFYDHPRVAIKKIRTISPYKAGAEHT